MAIKTACFCRHLVVHLFKRGFLSNKVLVILAAIFFLAMPNNAFGENVSLLLSPGGSHQVGDQFNIGLDLQTDGTQICSVRADLTFPKDLIEVISLAPGNVFTVEAVKNFSNENGTISYTIGVPGCTKNNTTVYTIGFRAKAAGSGEIKFTKTNAVTINDIGKPSSITAAFTGTSLSINNINTDGQADQTDEDSDTSLENDVSPSPSTSSSPATSPSGNSSGAPSSRSSRVTTTPPAAPSSSAQNLLSPSNSSSGASEDSTLFYLKTPNLVKIEFAGNAQFDTNANKSKGVIFYGTSDPDSVILITIDDKTKLNTNADNQGNWKATDEEWLTNGMHFFSATAKLDNQYSNQLITPFSLDANTKKVAQGSKLPNETEKPSAGVASKESAYKSALIIVTILFAAVLLILVGYIFYEKRKNKISNQTWPKGGL